MTGTDGAAQQHEVDPQQWVRPDLRDYGGYSSARISAPTADLPQVHAWLNANEAESPSAADPGGEFRRYPEPQPPELVAAIAAHYRIDPEEVLVGRGSDELIDVLIRTFCRPGIDPVVVSSPTFGMYQVGARLHGVPVIDVPAVDAGSLIDAAEPGRDAAAAGAESTDAGTNTDTDTGTNTDADSEFDRHTEVDRSTVCASPGWAVDTAAIAAASIAAGATLVFLASPGNPTGASIPTADIEWLADALLGHAVLVVDQAYAEFHTHRGPDTQAPDGAGAPDLVDAAGVLAARGRHPNLIVLRTLSKAHALASARVGFAVLDRRLSTPRAVIAPYPISGPATALAIEALQPPALQATAARVATTVTERDRLRSALGSSPLVTTVYPSSANFVLIRTPHADRLLAHWRGRGIVVRDMRHLPNLHDALRITIGTPQQVDQVIALLAEAAPTPTADHPTRTGDAGPTSASTPDLPPARSTDQEQP